MSDVSFDSGGVRCAGIHLSGEVAAAFAGEDGRRPCVVLANGLGGTVDSGILPFAQRFASAGLDALAFDYRHFGASDGEPRQLLSPVRQLEDYAAAIAFARSLEGVDPERIVVWGSSYSGGHAIAVAVADERVAAVIAQVPSMDGRAALLTLARYAGLGQLARLTLAGMRDLGASLSGRPPVMVPLVGPPGSLAAMTTPDAEPGYRAIAGPTWRNEMTARSALTTGTYRPGLRSDRLPCPMLVQIADRDSVAPVEAAHEAAWRATGRAEVRTYPIGHFDIYSGSPFERAIADQLHFLRRHIGTPSQGRAVAEARSAS